MYVNAHLYMYKNIVLDDEAHSILYSNYQLCINVCIVLVFFCLIKYTGNILWWNRYIYATYRSTYVALHIMYIHSR